MDVWKKTYLKRLFMGAGISALLGYMGLIDRLFEMVTLGFVITTLLYVVVISKTLNKEE